MLPSLVVLRRGLPEGRHSSHSYGRLPSLAAAAAAGAGSNLLRHSAAAAAAAGCNVSSREHLAAAAAVHR